jgi:hypothetical protein
MSWQDRVREAAYTSPSGTRIVFLYENVRYTFDKRGTAFNFPDAEGTSVQETGNSGRRYPLRVIFSGNDYDLESASFESAVSEVGTGKLDHPVYGSKDVVPLGSITRRDDLKTASNQAVFEVTFWETSGLIYPSSQQDPSSAVIFAIDELNETLPEEFDEVTNLDTAIEKVSLESEYNSSFLNTDSLLGSIASTQRDVFQQYTSIKSSIEQGISVLIDQPKALASQTLQLIQSPARAVADIRDRLDAYRQLISGIVDSVTSVFSKSRDSRNSNNFHSQELYSFAYLSGSIISVVNNQFETKKDAIEAAEEILAQFDDINDWRDSNYSSLDEIDTGSSYQKIQEAVALTAGFLVEISFTLKQERIITLDRDRTIIDVEAEIYGTVDENLDFLINSNNLTGSEILEIKKGKEIKYYI